MNYWMSYCGRLASRQHGKELVRVLRKTAKLVHKKDAPKFHLAAARLLTKAWKYEEAERHWTLAERATTTAEPAAAGLARMLERANRVQNALALLPRLGTELATLPLRAKLHRRAGDADAALEIVSDLARCERDMEPATAAEAWHEKFRIHDALGDYESAWAALLKSKEASRQAIGISRQQQWLASRRKTFARMRMVMDSLDRDTVRRWLDEGDATDLSPWYVMLGMPRSGTTLLENMLETHSEVISTDERDALAATILEPVTKGFSVPADEKFAANQFINYLDHIRPDTAARGHEAYREELKRQMDTYQPNKVLLDKNPGLMESVMLFPRLLPGASYIVPFRDPRAVLWSTFQVFIDAPSEISVFWTNAEDLAEVYEHTMQVWWKMRELLPQERFTECRYESLVENPQKEGRVVTDFMGLNWQEEQASPQEHVATKQLVLSPSYDSVTEAPHNKAVEKWKRYEPWIGQAVQRLDPWLEKLGYS
ncbi:sulfotransferase [Verrucomicrobiaceae bacterium 5K15]|uniref:Sulfotransferase n=1 Tax=Oceaniferula flava TaxID=2800421 RepID=A0AAE2V8T2_9BACT|nr:sulfotransferase [Oceaniferula flavus]MBK1854023.1 sulfotransferase [Oceaniferula flavus]MBM1135329.1 sulfotransferase [Oceaniferula flavus]